MSEENTHAPAVGNRTIRALVFGDNWNICHQQSNRRDRSERKML